jgi:regulator of sirC expression with transglutaminase-like and TPR domain
LKGSIAPQERLAQICARPEEEWDLAEAALLVAATEYPDLDPREGLSRLDEIGRRAALILTAGDPRVRALQLAGFLHEVERFDGNLEEYEDPRNSYLNEVLDRRVGLPILLSLVYCEVGRRAGVPFEGVGMPGRFIVKLAGENDLFLDPFEGGRVLSVEECERRVASMYRGGVAFSRGMLAASTPRATLVRILRNLKGVYRSRNDAARAWRITDLVLKVTPGAPEEIRDRGLLSLELRRHAAAAADLELYLSERPASEDRGAVLDAYREARRALASLN